MKGMRKLAFFGASLAAAATGACGDDDMPSAGTSDGGTDARPDASRPDVAIEAARDTAPDRAPDATADGGPDGEGGSVEGGDGGQTPVQRGEYIVNNVAACGDCHTPRRLDGSPDTTRFLAGVAGIFQVPGLGPDGGTGVIGSSNLTPDQATGLGSWTDAQIKAAFLDGVDKDMKPLFPIMPYFVLHNMSPEDANAVVAYLRTIPAVINAIPERNFDFPQAALPVPADRIPNPTLAATDPNYASAMRGKYLAGSIGICMECHTTHVQGPVPLDLDKLFAGGEAFPAAAIGLPSPPFPPVIYSVNVTPHATGIQGWTAAAVATLLKQGTDIDGVTMCPPMPVGPMGAFGGLTDGDARDIGNYLTRLPAIANTIPLACHDYMRRDGGPPDGPPDGPTGEGGNTPDSAPDSTTPPGEGGTPDSASDGTTSSDSANEGATSDAAQD